MSQTSVVFGAVMLGFLVYITINGDLKKWLSLLGI